MVIGILQRTAVALIVMLAVSAAIFFAGKALAPGSAASVIIGAEGASTEQTEELEHRLGLDQSLPAQYWDWLTGAVHGDFGESAITQRSATDTVRQEAPVTIEVAVLTLLLGTVIGLPLGVLCSMRPGGKVDVTLRSGALVGFALPSFAKGTLLVLFTAHFIPGLYAASQWVPFSQDPVANLKGMILPVITTTVPMTALVLQMTRGSMLETLSQPYIAMARARGVSTRRIYFIHALKNALPPVLTFLGYSFGVLLGGLVIVEEVFSLPGLGRGLVDNIGHRDYTLVMAEAVIITAAFVLGNLVVDLLEPVIDPRKRRA